MLKKINISDQFISPLRIGQYNKAKNLEAKQNVKRYYDLVLFLNIFRKIKSQSYFPFLFLVTLLLLINPTLQRNFTDDDCIYENNKNFDFYKPLSKLIDTSTKCTEKSNSCCYIEISYDYAGHLIDNSFCVLLGGDINSRIQQIIGVLTDQIRYYSNFIYNNWETITSIGDNLDYKYYENYTCYEQPQKIDYYSYAQDNCAYTNSDNTCKNVNDKTYSDNFSNVLYKNITKDFCNNRDELGNCVFYQQSPNYNESGLTPLLEYLKSSLDLDENSNDPFIEPAADPIEEKKNADEYSKKFYKNCKKIIPAKVKIICPSAYMNGFFFMFGNQNFFLILFLYLLIF